MANPLSGDVKVPGLGQVPKVLAYGGPVAVLGLIIWERHKNAGTAAAADTTTADTGTTETYQPGTDYSGGGGGGTGGGSGPGTFTTNGQWSRWVLGYFSDNGYGDQQGRIRALGLYLNGEAVDATQKQYIDEAIAVAGRPPVASPTNFPPSIRMTGSHGGTVTIPGLTGKSAGEAHDILRAEGLVPEEGEKDQKPADRVFRTNPGRGRKVQKGTRVLIYAGHEKKK